MKRSANNKYETIKYGAKRKMDDIIREMRSINLTFSEFNMIGIEFPIGEWYGVEGAGEGFESFCHRFEDGEGEWTMKFEEGGYVVPHYHSDVHERLEVLEGWIIDEVTGIMTKAHSDYIIPLGNRHFIKAPNGATIKAYTSKNEF